MDDLKTILAESEVKTTEQQPPAEDEVFVFPATFAQKRFWFLDQFEPGSPYYNIPIAFRLRGEFDVAIFKRTMKTIIARHESLRTTFSYLDGQPVQAVSAVVALEIPLTDLTSRSGAELEAEIKRLATIEARQPFDLKKGPLLRVSVIKAAPRDHVVLLTMHHIISDGWSMGVLIHEISTIYGAFLHNLPNPLPDLPIQYGDFADWQNENLQGEWLENELQFWKDTLGGNPSPLELPTDRPRPPVLTNVGSSTAIAISKATTDKLHKLAQKEGSTLFMTLLAAFNVLLYRYSGTPDICIGTPIANRTRKEIEGLIGLFINTLALRTTFYDNPTFRELLSRVRSTTLNAYEHQDLPFEYLVDALQLNRDMSYSPLFQVMLILQNAPVNVHPIGVDLTLEMINVDMGTSTFDLTMSVSESPAGLNAAVEFNTDLFDRASIERLLGHFSNLLESIIANPEQRLAQISYLSDEEYLRIVYDWNNFPGNRLRGVAIHQIFEQRELETPDAVAVVYDDERLTYDELNRRANQLASYLKKFAIEPETVVGVLLERQVNLLTAVLGVLKAGGAYLPMDSAYPEERLKYMLEDSAARVLITQENLRPLIHGYGGAVICLDSDWANISGEADGNPAFPVDEENMCYLIYTSGSTGKSKGTMVRHTALVNAYFGWEKAYELRTLARSHLQMASFSFDVFSGDWTRALCSGGKLVLTPRDILLDGAQIYALMQKEQITIAEFVPAVLRNLIQHLEENSGRLDFFRNLIAGSDIWYVSEYKKFLKFTGPNTRLINSFGLTEATIDSSYFESRELNLPAERLVPIGKPFNNMTIYLLDEYYQPVPPGVRGELYVGGESLARGYFNRPDLTAERFIPNPFIADWRLTIDDLKISGSVSQSSIINPQSSINFRLYRTGDMARYLPDGNIEFLGRADTQVKLRGFRIELGEIEIALGQHEAVKDAAVALREDKPGDKRLVAYYVPAAGKEPSTAELRNFLAEHLPDYMTPSAFVWLDKLPLTPNGKVDRRALPKPDPALLTQEMEEEYVAPRTPTEEVLCSIFTQLLTIEKAGAFSHFFDLGGHSLLATQLVSRIKQNFKVEIPLRSVFETPTIAGLAMAVDKAKLSGEGMFIPPILPAARDQELPLSFAQQRLWFLDQLEPNSPFYNIPESYLINGKLNLTVLQQAMNEVVRRHESLRTTFQTVNGQPKQIIHPELHLDLHVTDLSGLPADQKEGVVLSIAREYALKPIPINRLPLFNLEILRLAADEHAIILVIHHIVSDNWSTQVLMGEISLLYDSFSRGEASPLPDLPIQYADFACWQRNWLQGETLDKQLDYWRKQLSGSPPLLELPTDRPRPAVQTFNGSFRTVSFSKELSDGLKELSKQSGTTLFMTLMAAFKTLLFRYSGQNDISLGTPIANRNRGELENLIGFFVNTLVMRSDLSDDPTFLELLKRVRETALGAYAHQDLPFEKIVDAVQPERNMSHSPLFQVMFTLQSGQATDIHRPHSQLTIHPIEAHSATAKFDLTLFMVEDAEHLGGALEYNSDLFDAFTIERMLKHFEQLLQSIVSQPQQSISRLNMLMSGEQEALLHGWRGAEIEFTLGETIIEIFEKQARHNPENVAIEYEQTALTYAELNIRVNQLANHLISLGVAPDKLVGVSVPRSPQLIISLLAVLKAGGAYVPIDPSYPQERLNYIIEDSGVIILLTQEVLLDKFASCRAPVVCLDRDAASVQSCSAENPEVMIHPDHLAYMIYTSGSTGKPKGTMLSQRGLASYLHWCYQAYPLQEGRGSLVHSTIAFDATVTAVFTPLLVGKTITLVPDDADLEALGNALRKYRDFNIVKITPAHLDLLSQQIPAHEAAGLTRSFVIGGENLTAGQIAFWQKNAPDTLLFNEYGPTETVVGCVVYEAHEWRGQGSVPIGRVITNTSICILDENLKVVPQGVPGELYIGGLGVARGYHNRPELTAEKFIPDPFNAECRMWNTELEIPNSEFPIPNSELRLYKTGDLVRQLNDGNLEFLGRIDTQVKIRGYRIELGEIESIIRQHETIRDTAVIAREDVAGDKRLVAYCVMNDEKELDSGELRAFIKTQAPEYMIPAAFVKLAEIPLTPNGKVDRRALPKPDYGLENRAEFVAPRSPQEEQLAEIWKEILHLEKIGIQQNFFESGGHSLLATQLMSRIRDVFNVELPLRHLFEAPTIEGLAQIITQQAGRIADALPPLLPLADGETAPLSFAQQRLWFLDQLAPDNPFYNIPAAIRLDGDLNVEVLELSLDEIIRRHQALRTTFGNVNGQPQVKVIRQLSLKLTPDDLAHLTAEQQQAEIKRLAAEDALKPFKLDEGPLFRARLLKIAENQHVVLFNMHHIISDGWSTNVLFGEVAALYHAFSHGLPSPLPELTIQYSDFAAWQRSWLKEDALQKQIDFWKEYLGLNPPPLDLPADFPRPPVQTFNGSTLAVQLDKNVSAELRAFSQKEGSTLFMTLLSAFQTLLNRYSGQDEILIGAPIANRTRSETEALIGFFVNTLVFKGDFSDDPSFKAHLQRTREASLGAFAHQDIPFETLVDELQPERNLSHSPLFQVMFVFQNTSAGGMKNLPDLRMEALQMEGKTAKFDLTLVMADDPDGLRAEFEYNTDLFKRSTIERMLRHFANLLKAILADADRPLSQVSMIDPVEEKLLLRDWNQTQLDFPSNKTIQQLFEERAAGTPEAMAVTFENTTLSFSELNRRANHLAHFLRKSGVGPETLVGISLERSVEMVVALLGVLKAGGVYAPLDPAYPQERIQYIIEDAQIRILLTQQSLKEIFSSAEIDAICLDSDWPAISTEPEENPVNISLPENLAYVIYTSGSTGKPKGTMLQHRGLCNLTMAQIKDFQLYEGARCLQFASFSFDASVSEIFTTLISGATLYLANREELMPGAGLSNLLKNNKISVVTLPPSVSALLNSEEFPDLTTLISAGESCPRDVAGRWSKNRRFLNAYGPTENTVCASSMAVTQAPDSANIPIGKPIDNVQLYVLDQQANLLPIGVPGELHIGGVGLARGYLNRPDLTAEKFIPNPFIDDWRLMIDDLTEPNSVHQSTINNQQSTISSRLYRTGDLVRWLDDGTLEFLGRIDQQVKVRGFRIELGEIEHILAAHPSIAAAVVIAREDIPGDKKLVAYCVLHKGNELNNSELRNFLKTQLPEYMIPAAFLVMEEIPLTSNGKVNRRLLPKPEMSGDSRLHEFIAPRTHEEELLADIWRQLLHLEKISVNDNFFEIGGHSLLATQLVSRIRDSFQVELPLIKIFEAPTIEGLLSSITLYASRSADSLPPLTPAPRNQPLPLSFAQQRLWFLDQLAPDNASYNIPMALRFSGQFSLTAFEDSLNAIIHRHESLRTTFKNVNGSPLQVIANAQSVDLDVIDLSASDETKRLSEAQRLASEDALEPFDLENGPLFRVKILKLDADDHVVLFNMHHIISDGWSMNILVREFTALYEAHNAGDPTLAQLPELTVQYADFAAWQRQWLQGETLDKQIGYWKNQIGLNPEPLNLPVDKPRPPVQTFNGASESFILPKSLSDAVKRISRSESATLFMTLLAAYQTLLRRYSNQDSILVGSPIANRTLSVTEKLIGFFVNNIVLKTEFSDDPDFLTLLRRVRQTTLEAYSHQDLPFEQLVEILQPERDMSHAPIFQTVFVMQNVPMGAMNLSDIHLEPIATEQRIAKFDLTLIMMENDEGLFGEFEYNTDLFETETICRLQTHFRHLLQMIVARPQQPVDSLPMLPETERDLIIHQWNATANPFPQEKCIHQLFEEASRKYPSHPALILDNSEMSYKELNARSNQLAHYLRGRGVASEKAVGICLDRSFEMIIAMLGILKAGGAYLPIDPVYPQERINYIIEDSGIGLLLTQKSIQEKIIPRNISVICLDGEWKTIARQPKTALPNLILPENLAYVIYTSGSTGRPKGTLLQHRGLVNLTQMYRKFLPVNHSTRSLQFASFSFDASVEEIFSALTAGGTLILIKRETLLSGSGLIETLRRKKVTHATLPPSVLNVLSGEKFSELRSIISAGEACTPALTKTWAEGRRFFNGYGPTENTVCSTIFLADKPSEGKSVPIGQPIDNVTCYILDKYLNPVPIGMPGELHVGGVGLARGYLNRPDLTAEKFIPNPFIDDWRLTIDDLTTPNSVHQSTINNRLYKTGDLARWLPDGAIEFLGRIDEQIKIRGFRVELGEIETLILQNPDVVNAIVVARKSESNDMRLAAYLVVRDRNCFDLEALQSTLKTQLADYMLPSAYLLLDAIPLTPNGKVDYRALPQPQFIAAMAPTVFVAPRTAIEARLTEIWQEVLNRGEVSVTANFFELGGHSLLAMKLLTAVEQKFGKDINLVKFFQQPTIEYMAQMISAEQSEATTLQLIQLRKGSDDEPLFFVHPSGGAVHHYAELAKLLDTNRAFYGIQARGLDGKQDLHKTVEDMASAYIDLIIKKQPVGTYHIGGWSLGVIIAHEMARQFTALGRNVFLMQFDQGPHIERLTPKDNAEMLTNMFQRYFKLDTDYLRTLPEEEQFQAAIKKAKKHRVIPRFIRLADFKRYIVVNETQMDAWVAYQPKPFAGKIHLYRSEENAHQSPPDLGWSGLSTELEIIDIPGNHITMLQQPHVGNLAKFISKQIEGYR